MPNSIFFFIGTEAELIKLFPVMLELDAQKTPYKIIASGQNDIKNSSMLRALGGRRVDLELSDERSIRKSAAGLFRWFLSTWKAGKEAIARAFSHDELRGGLMVVHGDTVSTVMGAYLGGYFGMKVAHIEAGLRSHNWLNPFPEEIDRVLASHRATLHFAPGEDACRNLERARGEVINTRYNTIYDSLAYSRRVKCENPEVNSFLGSPYFVFVLHRQENLANKPLVRESVRLILETARRIRCVIILHKPTEAALRELGLLETIKTDADVTALERVEYFDFMKLLEGSQFVITDGGSNQEELSYMGKPCLIMRTHTERSDGLGKNVLLYGGDMRAVGEFIDSYERYAAPPLSAKESPCEHIARVLGRYSAQR